MSDNKFDKIIKQKIEDAKVVIPQSDWNAFSQKLKSAQAVEKSDVDFDQAIKDKLAFGIGAIPAADWNGFSSKLNNPTPPSLSDSEFDAFISDKVNSFSQSEMDPNWDLFADKMKKSTLDDKVMDEEIKERLSDYSTKYDDSHWVLLKEKMEAYASLRSNIRAVKTFEAMLALLLLVTFGNFFPGASSEIAAVKENLIATTAAKIDNSSIEQLAELKVEELGNESNVSLNNIDKTGKDLISTPILTSNSQVNLNSNTSIYSNTTKASITTSNNSVTELSTHNFVHLQVDQNNDDLMTSQDEADSNEFIHLSSIENLANISNTLTVRELERTIYKKLPSVVLPTTKETNKTSYNLIGLVGFNEQIINSPYDTLFGTPAQQSTQSSKSYQLAISKEINNLEIATGLGYTKLSYTPAKVEDINYQENTVLSFSQFQYEFIQIPLHIRCNQPLTKGFNFFVDLGLNNQIMITSRYDGDISSLNSGDLEPTSFPIQDKESISRFNRKEYQLGLLQGGNLKSVLHSKVDFGLGLTYSLNHQVDLMLRAHLEQQLGRTSLGPNGDNINTTGIQLGLKIGL